MYRSFLRTKRNGVRIPNPRAQKIEKGRFQRNTVTGYISILNSSIKKVSKGREKDRALQNDALIFERAARNRYVNRILYHRVLNYLY